MIDAGQLRDLGWSDDLIGEIVRKADVINKSVLGIGEIKDSNLHQESYSGSSLIFTELETDTSVCLVVNEKNRR